MNILPCVSLRGEASGNIAMGVKVVLHDGPCLTIHVKELEINPENNGGSWKSFKLKAKVLYMHFRKITLALLLQQRSEGERPE